VSVCNLWHNFLRFVSTDMFSTQCVDYETCSCACSHTLNICQHVCHNRNDVQLHDLTYELTNPSQYAIFHIQSLVWEKWFDPREGQRWMFTVKRRPSRQLFDLHGCVRMKMFRVHLWEIMLQTMCDMFKITHSHEFVSQNMCTHPSLSVRTCAWTRLMVNTLRGNMVAEIKHRKWCGK